MEVQIFMFILVGQKQYIEYIKLNIYTGYSIYRPIGYERVYLPLFKAGDTPFYIQGYDMHKYEFIRQPLGIR